eukprot:97458-Amorphochlora_amoeboformis.AAC.1
MAQTLTHAPSIGDLLLPGKLTLFPPSDSEDSISETDEEHSWSDLESVGLRMKWEECPALACGWGDYAGVAGVWSGMG